MASGHHRNPVCYDAPHGKFACCQCRLGLIQRKQNDWQTVLELTEKMRTLNPKDPVIYDFALFGMGVLEKP